MKNSPPNTKPLAEVELEMMRIIWNIEPCTIHEMLEQLPPQRQLAYTSVSTIVRILEQKQFVTSKKEGRGHRYTAAVPKDAYEKSSVHHLIENVFDGAAPSLVKCLIDTKSLSKKDLDAIRALIDRGSKP